MSEALRKAAQAALEALENLDGIDTETECVTICVGDEVDALRTALAEPEQSDPVAVVSEFGATVKLDWASVEAAHNAQPGPLYAAPPRREPEQEPVINQCDGCRMGQEIRNGLHIDRNGTAQMTCQAYRYQSPRREPLSDEQVGMLTVFPGLHHVETPLLAAFIRHIEQAITGEKT